MTTRNSKLHYSRTSGFYYKRKSNRIFCRITALIIGLLIGVISGSVLWSVIGAFLGLMIWDIIDKFDTRFFSLRGR